jgi:DNA polymerase IV
MFPDKPSLHRSWPRALLHVDGDAFFASCEQSIHPELRGKPIITGKERNIVASMSYEAKALGIKRATPVWEAKKICPALIVLPSDYETYSLISKRMFSIMRRFSPAVEESSIDEGFVDLTGLRRLHHTSYAHIARHITKQIRDELDIPVSAGLSLTKTLAKLASKHKKPLGFVCVSGHQVHIFLKQILVSEVCGIGPNTTAFLEKNGIRTASDYAQRSKPWIQKKLGKIGSELWSELRGDPAYTLNTEKKESYQTISKTKTFIPPSSNYQIVKARLFRNAESAFTKMRRYRLGAKRLVIYLREQGFKSHGLQSDLSRPAVSPMDAFPLLQSMLQKIYKPGILYRQTGITLSGLEMSNSLQFELFEDSIRILRTRRLIEHIDHINALYGKHTIHGGTGLYLERNFQTPSAFHINHLQLPDRKTALLPGETKRQRLAFPLVKIKV